MQHKQKIFLYISYSIIIYITVFIIGSAINGGGVLGLGPVIKPIFRPLELTIRYTKNILKSGTLEGENASGHLTRRNVHSNKLINKLDTDFYILLTALNNGHDQVEIRNLRLNKIIRKIDIPKELEKKESWHRFKASIDNKKRNIVVMENDGKNIGLFDLKSNKWLWIKTHDSLIFHHRILFDGTNVICNVRKLAKLNNINIINEGYCVINSTNGKILKTWWINDHINELSNSATLKGINWCLKEMGESEVNDFWHINDVKIAHMKNSKVFDNGDVLLSLRHLSTILQIRDDKIINCYTGTFGLQHDIDFVNENTISIFNNNLTYVSYPWIPEPKNNIIYKNLETGIDSIAFDNIGLSTRTEGQFEDLGAYKYFENQNKNEIIILKHNKMVYRSGISNSHDSKFDNLLNWCVPFLKF